MTQTGYSLSRWGMYGVGFLTRAASFGMVAISVPLLLERGVPLSFIGVILAAAAVGSAGAQLLVGRLADRLGPWGASVGGCVIAAVGLVVFAAAGESWPVLSAANFVLNAGLASASNSLRTATAMAAEDGKEERAFGSLSSAQTAGGLFGPLVLGLIATDSMTITPWFAAGCCIAGALVAALSRVTVPLGQPSDDDKAGASTVTLRTIAPIIAPLLLLVVAISASYGIYAAAWGVLLHDRGASNAVIAWSFSVFSVPFMLVAARADKVLPRVDRRWVLAGAIIGLALIAFAYAALQSVWAIVGLGLLEGAVFGVAMPLMHSQVAVMLPPGSHGRGFGLVGAADQVAVAVGSGVAGLVLTYGGASFAFRVGAVVCLVAVAVGITALRMRDRKNARVSDTIEVDGTGSLHGATAAVSQKRD
ncbi:MFS transporter [Streptomyces hydrogenans]|uniref:MFS transporter n=1 Tax=Streptomyces hydrogenans TaxID=1873719 RepID=UPI00365DD69F